MPITALPYFRIIKIGRVSVSAGGLWIWTISLSQEEWKAGKEVASATLPVPCSLHAARATPGGAPTSFLALKAINNSYSWYPSSFSNPISMVVSASFSSVQRCQSYGRPLTMPTPYTLVNRIIPHDSRLTNHQFVLANVPDSFDALYGTSETHGTDKRHRPLCVTTLLLTLAASGVR